MKDIAIDCYMSARNSMNPSKRRHSFEFFGFDFMIDEDFRVWLIEVNTNPLLAIHNKRMSDLLPNMLADLLKINLDPVFEDLTPEEKNNIHEDTDFDLIYSRNKGINKRRDVFEGIYPIKELDTRKTYPRKFKKMAKKSNPQAESTNANNQTQRELSDARPSALNGSAQKTDAAEPPNRSSRKPNINEAIKGVA